MYDVVGLGELLIDFTTKGRDNGKPNYTGNPGGAPINVCAAITRLGGSSAYLSKVGDDTLGKFLIETLNNIGIDSKGVMLDKIHNTTISFVDNAPNGDRSFCFYRRSCADACYDDFEVKDDIVKNAKVLQIGSIMMDSDEGYRSTIKALRIARENGVLISFDPNIRKNILQFQKDILIRAREVLEVADIVKMSENEIVEFTGIDVYEKAATVLLEKYSNIKLLLITLGENGAIYSNRRFMGKVKSRKVKAVDTTGCGDAFTGGLLSVYLGLNKSLTDLTEAEIVEMVTNGCNVGAFVATQYGGVMSMPTVKQIQKFMEETK